MGQEPISAAKVEGSPYYQDYMKSFDRTAVELEKYRDKMARIESAKHFFNSDSRSEWEHRGAVWDMRDDTLQAVSPTDHNNILAVAVLSQALREILSAAETSVGSPTTIGGLSVPQYFNQSAEWALRRAAHDVDSGIETQWQIQKAIQNIARTYRTDFDDSVCGNITFREWMTGPEKDMVVFIEHSTAEVDMKVTTLSFSSGRIVWETGGLLLNVSDCAFLWLETNALRISITEQRLIISML